MNMFFPHLYMYSAAATVGWSLLAAEWFAIELGSDSEHALRMRGFAAQPRGHYAWGTRQAGKVEGPRR
jgi:hypothetical protein